MPTGPVYDGYKVYIVVNIQDDFGGITEYKLPTSVKVELNSTLSGMLMSQMMSMSAGSTMVKAMFSGNPQVMMQNVNSMVSMLNTMAATNMTQSTTFNFGPSSLGAGVSFANLSQLRSQLQTNITPVYF